MEVDSFRMSVRVRNWSSSGWRSMVFCLALALALLMGIWVELGIGDLEREKEERERLEKVLEVVVFLRKLLFGDVIYRDMLNFILSTRFMIENYL